MYPVALSLRGRRVTVVGGGDVAQRHVGALLESDAAVTVISPSLTTTLRRWADDGRIAWHARGYRAGDLDGAALAFASTGDDALDGRVAADARAAAILVNAQADAARSDFVTPAMHRSGPFTVTVDGAGIASAIAPRIRDELALQFDARYARAAHTLDALHERAQAVVPVDEQAAVMGHFAARDVDELAAMRPSAIEHEVERAVDTLAGVVPSQTRPLACATRASLLAMTQTRTVMAQLAAAGIPSVVVEITTRGDSITDRPIAAVGSENVFVKELELALRDGRADYAVHSCKDLPSELPEDMELIAVGVREDARDVFCSERFATFDALPPGARVGTSSPRRRAQLRALRRDLVYDDIRGNVDTRLRKLRDGEYDAIVLAAAGMRRLSVRATHTVPFDPAVMTPAVAQGALGIETRVGHRAAAAIAAVLDHAPTAIAVRAERAFLRTVHGGCSAPVGAYGVWADGRLQLSAAIAADDGSQVVRETREALLDAHDRAGAERLGAELAEALLAAGGADLLAGGDRPLAGSLIVLGPAEPDAGRIAAALRSAGADVLEVRDSVAASAHAAGRVPDAVLVTSPQAVDALSDYLRGLPSGGGRPIVGALGGSSTTACAAIGWTPDVVASSDDVGAFVQSVMLSLLETRT